MQSKRYTNTCQWPKIIPTLSQEDQAISDDFMNHWLTVLPGKYGVIETFNHGFPASIKVPGRTLEIGAGRCKHFEWETEEAKETYCAVEFRKNIADDARKLYPSIHVVEADCQKSLPFPNGHFSRVLAIHVLEHLDNLPAALTEAARVLDIDGKFVFVIPCLNSLAYKFAQKISAARIFKQRYGRDYNWFIDREHINSPEEIIPEVEKSFTVEQIRRFPLNLPISNLNICMAVVCGKKRNG